MTFVAEYGGKDYPITRDPTRDTIFAKRIDLYTHQTKNKKIGQITTTGKNVQGQEVNNVQVSEKQ